MSFAETVPQVSLVRKQSGRVALLWILFMCTSVYAQVPDASPDRTLWDHNGSVMYLVARGSVRDFFYEKPRSGMLEMGVKTGSLLFHGEVNNGRYTGTARIFNSRCGQMPFQVNGEILDSGDRIVLTGQAPRLSRKCKILSSYSSTLEFTRLKSPADSPAPAAQKADEAKSELSLTGSDTQGTASAPIEAANGPLATAEEPTGNVHPPNDTPSARRRKKPEFLGDDLDNYVLAGAITVLAGALLFFFGSQISRKLFWPRGF